MTIQPKTVPVGRWEPVRGPFESLLLESSRTHQLPTGGESALETKSLGPLAGYRADDPITPPHVFLGARFRGEAECMLESR